VEANLGILPLYPNIDKWQTTLRKNLPTKMRSGKIDGEDHFVMTMVPGHHTFHPKLKNIDVWTFDGTYPGPTLLAKPDKPTRVSWKSELFDETGHPLKLKNLIILGELQGMQEDHMLEKPHNMVHLHGAHVPATSDGFPMNVFHPGEGVYFRYPNTQAASTLWYHDHTMDVTRLNVYAGLFGLYLIRGDDEDAVLPSGPLEIPLLLQDKSFQASPANPAKAQLYYAQPLTPGPLPEFVGDYPVVNGKIWPRTTLAPRIYRLRLVNAANARFFNIRFTVQNGSAPDLQFHIIGSEGGFLPAPVDVTSLTIGPGERYDVLLDLRDPALLDQDIIVTNDHDTPATADAGLCAELVKIRVQGSTVAADSAFDPATIILPKRVDSASNPGAVARSEFASINAVCDGVPMVQLEADLSTAGGRKIKFRRFVLEEYQDKMLSTGSKRVPNVRINGRSWDTAHPVRVKSGDCEVWEFHNTTPDDHPMHVHLVQFQVLARKGIDIQFDPGNSSAARPNPKTVIAYDSTADGIVAGFEMGFKDTVICRAPGYPDPEPVATSTFKGHATRIAMTFDMQGTYVYHCHILEHEDMGMMFRVEVD
jgi:spore coat protein A, manganese oxidase